MRKAPQKVRRGVWVAPWDGPEGETIIVAVNRLGRRVDYRILAEEDANEQAVAEAVAELWEVLNRVNPIPALQVI